MGKGLALALRSERALCAGHRLAACRQRGVSSLIEVGQQAEASSLATASHPTKKLTPHQKEVSL